MSSSEEEEGAGAGGAPLDPDRVIAALKEEEEEETASALSVEVTAPPPQDDSDDEEGFFAGRFEVASASEDSDLEDDISHLHRRRVMHSMSGGGSAFSDDDDDEFKSMALASSAAARERSEEVSASVPVGGGAAAAAANHLGAGDEDPRARSATVAVPAPRAPAAAAAATPSPTATDPTVLSFRVIKYSKLGVRQPRELQLDTRQGCLRFSNMKGAVKSEFPFTEVLKLEQQAVGGAAWDRRRVLVFFRGSTRVYVLKFPTTTAVEEFLAASRPLLVDDEQLSVLSQQRAAGHSRAASSASSAPGSPAAPHDDEDDEDDDAAAAAAPLAHAEDPSALLAHADEYLEYAVRKKRNLIKQDRILVLNPTRRRLTVLNAQRKFRKELDVDNIVQMDLPRTSASGKVRLFIVFAPPQRPYALIFSDLFDRAHFCDRVRSMNNEIVVRDEALSADRYAVIKETMLARKKRLLYLTATTIESLDVTSRKKEVSLSRVVSVIKSPDERRRLTLHFRDRSDWDLVFSDAAARERFALRLRCLLRGERLDDREEDGGEDDDKPAGEMASGTGFGEPLTVVATTFNCGDTSPPASGLGPWLGDGGRHDLYAVSLQEATHREQWFAAVAAHLGGDYAPVAQAHLGKIALLVMARGPLLPRVTSVCTGAVATGVANVARNKGSVGVSLVLDDTSLCFVGSHLAARAKRLAQRRADVSRTVREMRLGATGSDILHQFDHLVWLGDLNYRVELPYGRACELADGGADGARELAASDQLRREMAADSVFVGFREGDIAFAPTYRLSRTSAAWSNKRNQPPSYTDRVLWRSLAAAPGDEEMRLEAYESRPDMLGSDHRPVVARFLLAPRQGHLLGLQRDCQQCEISLSSLYLESSADCRVRMPDLRVLVSAPFLEADAEGELVRFASNETSWMWPTGVTFTPFMPDPEFLRRLSARITVIDEARRVFGRCVLPMHNALLPSRVALRVGGPRLSGQTKKQQFRLKVTSSGVKVGVLTGVVVADFRLKRGSTMTVAGRGSVVRSLQ